MWQEVWPWLIGALVLVLGAVALWQVTRRPRPSSVAVDNHRARSLELWLAGDLIGARDSLREVVAQQPEEIEPYLQLGTLYRLTGDPGRAAALHRSLAVRPQLPAERRLAVAFELASDLIDLGRWQEAEEVLGQLASPARRQERWYRLRFAAAVGRDDQEAAVKALRDGEKALDGAGQLALRRLRAAWLTDRALLHARANRPAEARAVLALTRGLREADGRRYLVDALASMAADEPEKAVRAVEQGLAAHPAEMAPLLPVLEGVLADAGHFLRIVPILEEACGRPEAPPAVWMALARIYEKLDRHDDAVRLLAGKRGDPRLTPDAAAPYLRLLTAEVPGAAFTRVWNLLSDPRKFETHRCTVCDRVEKQWRWFCPSCLSADSYVAGAEAVATTDDRTPDTVPVEPPRY